MDHPFLVVAIVLMSFIALAQPKMRRGYGYGHGRSYKGHGHDHKGHGHKGHGHKGYGHKSKTQYCSQSAVLYSECGIDKRCAYNRRECPSGSGCRLICTNNPYKFCYGRVFGNVCYDNQDYQCWPDQTGQLVCIDLSGTCAVV